MQYSTRNTKLSYLVMVSYKNIVRNLCCLTEASSLKTNSVPYVVSGHMLIYLYIDNKLTIFGKILDDSNSCMELPLGVFHGPLHA
jgi:hypothetical protein